MRYVALLRGINVGGNNAVSMKELKAAFEDAGMQAVATYINSGNVLFETPKADAKTLARKLERAIDKAFGLPIAVTVRSHAQLRSIVKDAPKGFGSDPKRYRYDAIFVIEPLTARAALKDVPTKDGVDQVWAGRGVIYFARLIAKATQSKMSKMVGTQMYKSTTVRNWNTTTKLLSLLDARED